MREEWRTEKGAEQSERRITRARLCLRVDGCLAGHFTVAGRANEADSTHVFSIFAYISHVLEKPYSLRRSFLRTQNLIRDKDVGVTKNHQFLHFYTLTIKYYDVHNITITRNSNAINDGCWGEMKNDKR